MVFQVQQRFLPCPHGMRTQYENPNRPDLFRTGGISQDIMDLIVTAPRIDLLLALSDNLGNCSPL